MTEQLIDTIASLTSLIVEETTRLTQAGRLADHREISAAKARLADVLDGHVARLHREDANWFGALPADDADRLTAQIVALREAALLNASILARQIGLVGDMMAVVRAELRRLSGGGTSTYCKAGALSGRLMPAPLAIDRAL